MARIPTLSDSPRVSTNVPRDPTLSPAEASAGSRGLAQASGQIANSLGRMHQQQVAEANKVSYTKAKLKFTEQVNNEIKQLDQEFDGTNYEGYSQVGIDRLKQRKDEILKSAPEAIRETLGLELESSIVRQKARLSGMEANNKSKYAVNETQALMKSAASGAYSEWDPEQNFKNTQSIRNLINSSTYYDANTKKALQDKITNISKDMLNGVVDRGDIGEMQQALNDLNSPELEPLFGDMDIKDKTKQIAKLEGKIKSKQNENRSKVNNKYKQVITSLGAGTLEFNDPQDRDIIDNVKNEIMVTMEPEQAKAALADIAIYENANVLASEGATDIFNLDVEKAADEIFSAEGDDLFKAAGKAEAISVLGSLKQQRINEFKKSPADYIVKYDKSIGGKALEIIAEDSGPEEFNDYMTSMDAAYDKMGVRPSDRKYLPSQLKSYYGDTAKKALAEGDPRSATVLLNELDKKSNGDMYKIYDELDIPQQYAASFEIVNPTQRGDHIMNIARYENDIKPRFNDISDSEEDKSIMGELRKDPFYKSILNMDGGRNPLAGENAETIAKSALIEYKVARLGGATKEEARKEAWSGFKNSYDIVENGQYPIPVRAGKYDSGKIQNFVDNYTNQDIDLVNKFGIDVPEKYNMEEVNESLKDSGFWSYNKKSDSLRLLYYNPKNNRVQAAMKDGEPLSVPLSEINNMKGIEENVKKKHLRNVFMAGGFVPPEVQPEKEEGMSFKVEGFFKR